MFQLASAAHILLPEDKEKKEATANVEQVTKSVEKGNSLFLGISSYKISWSARAKKGVRIVRLKLKYPNTLNSWQIQYIWKCFFFETAQPPTPA